MDPPSKCFTKLVYKNTIKPEKKFTTTIYPTPRNLAKSLMDPPVFSNRVHRACYDHVLNSDVYSSDAIVEYRVLDTGKF